MVSDYEMPRESQRTLRSFVTCRADAFTAPYALTDRVFSQEGSNRLTPREQALADVYEFDLHRPDLARYVRGGKKFQRTYEFLRFERVRPRCMNAMRRAFLGLGDEALEGEAETKKSWYSEVQTTFRKKRSWVRDIGRADTTRRKVIYLSYGVMYYGQATSMY